VSTKPKGVEDIPLCYKGLRKAKYILLHRILLPGGATYFDIPSGYQEAGQKLYKLAMQMNQGGDFFPMLGICLGFELLTYLASNNVEHRARCYSYNETLPLEFKRGKLESNYEFQNLSGEYQ
jgi:GMP synthase-like glutamine amidotransferase